MSYGIVVILVHYTILVNIYSYNKGEHRVWTLVQLLAIIAKLLS